MESMIKKQVEAILTRKLEADKVHECLEQLRIENILKVKEKFSKTETISVEGSHSKIYSKLLSLNIERIQGFVKIAEFINYLRIAVKAKVEPFEVPVYDPSIDKDGSLQFVSGFMPAVGYSYNELRELASNNCIQLGSKNQYILFLATIINRLIEANWPKEDAFYAVCNNSQELGHYCNSTC